MNRALCEYELPWIVPDDVGILTTTKKLMYLSLPGKYNNSRVKVVLAQYSVLRNDGIRLRLSLFQLFARKVSDYKPTYEQATDGAYELIKEPVITRTRSWRYRKRRTCATVVGWFILELPWLPLCRSLRWRTYDVRAPLYVQCNLSIHRAQGECSENSQCGTYRQVIQ